MEESKAATSREEEEDDDDDDDDNDDEEEMDEAQVANIGVAAINLSCSGVMIWAIICVLEVLEDRRAVAAGTDDAAGSNCLQSRPSATAAIARIDRAVRA
jgi:hypothetical protein